MRGLLVVLLLCASVARAQSPPSLVMERAIKLYDKADYLSASIELSKVLDPQGGSPQDKQRAEFFMVKTLYQLKFYVAAHSKLFQIFAQGKEHTYFNAAAKWAVAIIRVAPSPTARSSLSVYRDREVLDDPSVASISDELAYELARDLATRDVPKPEVLSLLARVPAHSPFAGRAQLEIARIRFRMKDIDEGIAAAMGAARSKDLLPEAARLIASWTHLVGEPLRAKDPLRELAKANDFARYQLSRALLDGRSELPGLGKVSAEAFDAVMLASACRGGWPDDIKPIARATITAAQADLAQVAMLEDNSELYAWAVKMQKHSAVISAAMSDPIMRERLAWLAEIEHELGAVQLQDKAWQTTQVAADVLQELTVVQALEQSEAGAHARQRLVALKRDLDQLATVLQDASPAFAVSAGPDVDLGHGLVVTGELCRRTAGGTTPAMASGPHATSGKSGCAGCSTSDPSLFVALLLLVLIRRRVPAKQRGA